MFYLETSKLHSNKVLFSIIIFILIILSSCSKQHSFQELQNNQTLVKKNILRLKFDTKENFSTTLLAITSGNQEKINTAIAKKSIPSNFISLNANLNISNFSSTVKRSVLDTWRDDLVPDPYFAALLNPEREIEVADHIYKITKFGTFEIDPVEYERATEIIDSLELSGAVLTDQQRKFAFESNTATDNFYLVENGIYRYDTYKDIELQSDDNSGEMMPAISYTTTNPYGIPQNNIYTTDYTDDKVFKNFSSSKRIRANIHDYNWLINTYMEVELLSQIKGWTGGWRGFQNIEELALHLNNLVVKRKLVAGVDGYPAPGTYYYPQFIPVGSSVPSGARGTVTVSQNSEYLTFNVFPAVNHTYNGPTLYMGFIPLVNAAAGGTVDVLSIDLGCYGKDGGIWVGIEYKR